MRRFGTSPDREPTDYQRGYRMGVVHTTITGFVGGGFLLALRWAYRTDALQAAATWLTTPQITPATLLGGLFFVVLAWVVLGTLISAGRFSA